MYIDENRKLVVGAIVADRYDVVSILGEGGMGQVALVRQRLTHKLGAMKLLTAMAPEIVDRFNREAAAPSRLNHPAFPTVFDFGQHNGLPYIVMDFVEGSTVNGAYKAGHRFSLAEIVEIGSQVCDAMSVAHQAGLVHRDLKADNIMLVTRNGQLRVYVLDLGIARFSAEAGGDMRTKTGMLLGTPVTMSPEQAQGRPVDGRSDVYSLGCVLFYLATGQYPFDGDEPLQIAMKQVLDTPPLLNEVAPWIPSAFAKIVDRTLAKDKKTRVQSMLDLSELLKPFATSAVAPPSRSTGNPTLANGARQSTPAPRTLGSLSRSNGQMNTLNLIRRSPWPTVGAIGALVAVCVAGTWMAVHRRQARDHDHAAVTATQAATGPAAVEAPLPAPEPVAVPPSQPTPSIVAPALPEGSVRPAGAAHAKRTPALPKPADSIEAKFRQVKAEYAEFEAKYGPILSGQWNSLTVEMVFGKRSDNSKPGSSEKLDAMLDGMRRSMANASVPRVGATPVTLPDRKPKPKPRDVDLPESL